MAEAIGILAYGSLIDEPGDEIRTAIVRIVKDGIKTPFKVEFARKSSSRKNAPTLIPVEEGGAHVNAQIFVLNVSETDAANILYRRETRQANKDYEASPAPGPNTVIIERVENFHGIDVVLYTRIGANIEPLTSTTLAKLAIASAQQLGNGKDGISYLIDAKRNAIQTALSDSYEAEIKRLTRQADLGAARASLRPSK